MFKTVTVFAAIILATSATPGTLVAAPYNVVTSQTSEYFVRNIATLPVAAKLEAEPVVVPVSPVVTSQSSQFFSRNYNALAAPAFAPAPLISAAPLIATSPVVSAAPVAPVIAPAAPTKLVSPVIEAKVEAPVVPAKVVAEAVPVSSSSQYFIRNNLVAPVFGVPVAASPAAVAAPVASAEEPAVEVEEARVRNLSDKLVQKQTQTRVNAKLQTPKSARLELFDGNNNNDEGQSKSAGKSAQKPRETKRSFVAPAASYVVGPRVYL